MPGQRPVALGAVAPLYLLSANLWWLIAVSVVRGYGFGVLTVIGATLTARIAPPGRLGEVIGLYGLGIALPNLFAVPAGAALVLHGHFAWVAALAASPLLALPLLGVLGRRGAPRPGDAHPSAGGLGAAMRAAGPPAAVLLAVTMAGGSVITFLPIERPDGILAPIALLVFGGTGTLARWRAGALADRMGTKTLLPASLVASTAGLLGVAAGLGMSSGPTATTLVLVGAACFGLGYGATQNLTQVVAFARAGTGGTGQASAVWNVAFDGGTAIGAYAVGAIAAGADSFPWTYAGCAVLIALLLPLAFARTPSVRETPEHAETYPPTT